MDAELLSESRLDIGGFLYYRSTQRNGKTYWDCKRVRDKQCAARAVTSINSLNDLMVEKGPENSRHRHPPNREEIIAEKIKIRIKNAAKNNPTRPPSAIIRGIFIPMFNASNPLLIFNFFTDELAGTSARVLNCLPERENIKKSMRRERRKNAPPNPKSLNDLEDLPEEYKATVSGDKFLLYDSRDHDEIDDGRVLVFSTKQNLEILSQSQMWFLDGTFKVSPTIFTQVFTVMCIVPSIAGNSDSEHVCLPMVYALLSSKEEVQYTAVMRALHDAAGHFGFRNFGAVSVMTDLELAIINSVEEVYPQCSIRLCFFHLKQNLYRKIQSLGLQVAYNSRTDSSIRDYATMIAATAYVPVNDVILAFRELMKHTPAVMDDFVSYFDRIYVTGTRAVGRRRAVPPRYPPEQWNLYDAVTTNEPTTNNASEGWHNRFASLLEKNHPDLYSLLREFQKEQGDTEIGVLELKHQRRIKASPKKKWVLFQRKMKNVALSYQEFGLPRIIAYLQLISSNINLE